MTIHVYGPEGNVGRPARELAKAPTSLEGRRLAILDNGKPNAGLLMGRIAERLVERTGLAWVGVWRKQTAATPCEADLLAEIADAADLVLTGSAD